MFIFGVFSKIFMLSYDCCYFEADWDKEDLSLGPVDLASAERERVKLRRENDD